MIVLFSSKLHNELKYAYWSFIRLLDKSVQLAQVGYNDPYQIASINLLNFFISIFVL